MRRYRRPQPGGWQIEKRLPKRSRKNSTRFCSHLTAARTGGASDERQPEKRPSASSESHSLFLYYRVEADRVEVLALWHYSRLKGPELKEPHNTPLQPSAEKRGG